MQQFSGIQHAILTFGRSGQRLKFAE